MHIKLLFLVVLCYCFCTCLWKNLISDAVYIRTGFSWTSWNPQAFLKGLKNLSIKISVSFLFSEIPDLESYFRVVVCKSNNFLVTCYVLMTGLKANQNPSITWCTHCSDLEITANQIIFHIFQQKSSGLHTRLTMVNYRRPFSDLCWGEGALAHRLHITPAYPGMIVNNLFLNIRVIFNYSFTVVRFVEMNFEQFHQQSKPYIAHCSSTFLP